MSTNNRRQVYEQIRYLVLNEATNGDKTAQGANKKLAEECLRTLCRTFDPAMPPEKFWIEGWHHFRRAGIRASTGSNDIEAHELCGVFSDFRPLCPAAWDFPAKGLKGDWGAAAKKYIDRDSPYDQRGMVRNRHKLTKTVRMARLLTDAVDKYGHAGYLAGIFGSDFLDEVKKPNSDRVRNWHQSLCEFIGGNNSITAFHLMMDLGLPCVKPDIVLTDIFFIDLVGSVKRAYQGECPEPKFATTTCQRRFTGLCNELRSTLQAASSPFLDPTQFVRWSGLWSNMAKSRNLAGAFAEI